MSKAQRAMREMPFNAWRLDNNVGVRGGRARHRTWRPMEHGRPLYARYHVEDGQAVCEGPLMYTFCGREVYLNPGMPARACGVCFRGTA